jgi:flagellar basal-body rod protein FlgF
MRRQKQLILRLKGPVKMSEIISQASSAVAQLEREFELIAHNLANTNTVGYKRRCNTFSKVLAAQQQLSAEGSSDAQEGISEAALDFSQGSIFQTGRSLDLALYGRGFFVVETPEGPLYTRNGMFRLDTNGQIVNTEGKIISGNAGPITVPPNADIQRINVSADGTISTGGNIVGKLKIVELGDNREQLVSVGKSCFSAPDDAEPVEAQNTIVKQGYLESSNVEIAEELVDMMMVTRLYEANMKIISVNRDASSSLMNVAMS